MSSSFFLPVLNSLYCISTLRILVLEQRNMLSSCSNIFFSFSAICLNYVIFLLLATQPTLLNCAIPSWRQHVRCPRGYDPGFSTCEPYRGNRAYRIACLEVEPPPLPGQARVTSLVSTRVFNHRGECGEREVCVDIPYSPDRPGVGGAYCITDHNALSRIEETSQQKKRKRPDTG